MEKIHWTFKKILSLILGALGIGTLTSCYGMPIYASYYGMPPNLTGYNFELTGNVKGDLNDDGIKEENIQNIKVTIKQKDNTNNNSNSDYNDLLKYIEKHTLDDGSYYLFWNTETPDLEYEITFTDIDGEENGSFENKTIPVTFTDDDLFDSTTYYKTIDIELDKKQKNDN